MGGRAQIELREVQRVLSTKVEQSEVWTAERRLAGHDKGAPKATAYNTAGLNPKTAVEKGHQKEAFATVNSFTFSSCRVCFVFLKIKTKTEKQLVAAFFVFLFLLCTLSWGKVRAR